MPGFDWVTYEQEALGITADLGAGAEPSPTSPSGGILEAEGLSGSTFDDVLRGDDEGRRAALADVALIAGLSALLQDAATFSGGNIILGGSRAATPSRAAAATTSSTATPTSTSG